VTTPAEKSAVRDFWEQASCGEQLYLHGLRRDDYLEQARQRYALEPYIERFADFAAWDGKRVLEIGVGLGADHQGFALAGARLSGIDLTERAVSLTRHRLSLFGLQSALSVGDAENLSFTDAEFDLVYSWGVIHHTPNTAQAVEEIRRVLRPGGIARVMIYHKWSLVGYMLWARYALGRLRPWITLSEVYSRYLESPGTKAYSVTEARRLFGRFASARTQVVLTHGDLLESGAGQRHQGVLLKLARRVWPRALLRRLLPGQGLFLLIEAVK
jgi:ubiquinone/menaquinone biosynthesis C-methylase UbiE